MIIKRRTSATVTAMASSGIGNTLKVGNHSLTHIHLAWCVWRQNSYLCTGNRGDTEATLSKSLDTRSQARG